MWFFETIKRFTVSGSIFGRILRSRKSTVTSPEEVEAVRDQNRSKLNKSLRNLAMYDAEFIKVDQRTLFDLVMAAKYLEIKGLLDVTCKAVANMIKGKSPEELCRTFNIKNDFSPEEAEQIRKWNAWCED
ncbi:unnamed protein product [Caenorhabditis nigoni]